MISLHLHVYLGNQSLAPYNLALQVLETKLRLIACSWTGRPEPAHADAGHRNGDENQTHPKSSPFATEHYINYFIPIN
jgi:hypothetical protein